MNNWEMLDMLNRKDEMYFNLTLESLEKSHLAKLKGNHDEADSHMRAYDIYKAKLDMVREIKNEWIRSL